MKDSYELILFLLIGGELKRCAMQVGINDTLSESDEEFLKKVTDVLHRKAPYMAKNGSQLLDIQIIDDIIFN